MSQYFAESNNEKTSLLFNKREVYKGRTLASVPSAKNIVDFNQSERCYFGKVDHYFSPVFVKHNSMLKRLLPSEQSENYMAINFVADLFNEMALQFDRCVATGQIAPDDPYLSKLKVYRAFEDPMVLYREYKKILFAEFRNVLNVERKHIEDFDHFMREFLKAMPRFLKAMPFTFPSFIKSRENPITSTGLAIELADLPYDNDHDKKEMFLNSKNWNFFVNACNKYGFLIDYNIPWRIVCDLKADEIHHYVSPYFYSAKSMLDNDLSKASLAYMVDFVDDLNNMYKTCIKKSFIKTDTCDGKLIKKRIRPPTYTREQLMKKYSPRYFAKLYLRLRLLEERPDMPAHEMRKIIKDIIIYTDTWEGSWMTIENKFEKFINKPFDKQYSFTYTYNVELPAKERTRTERDSLEKGYSAEPVAGGQGSSTGY